MGTESAKPEMFTLTYPATRFCTIAEAEAPDEGEGDGPEPTDHGRRGGHDGDGRDTPSC